MNKYILYIQAIFLFISISVQVISAQDKTAEVLQKSFIWITAKNWGNHNLHATAKN